MKFNIINKNIYFYIIPIIVAIFNILIILTPNIVINSSRNGLLLWFNSVLPSLLPFLIGTNLLIRLGFIDFLGALLEPFMKKLFNVSGIGAFPLVLGMFSGYPMGAKIVSDLRINNKISRTEGNRLLTFTNNSGPLFILGTVSLGMFKSVKLGYLMLFIHYISAISTGLIFKRYKYKEQIKSLNNKISFKIAFKKLKEARVKENKTFGEILSESVKNALEIVVTIGGFIIFFSVISELFNKSNIFNYIGNIVLPDNLKSLSNGIFMGLIEMTNGCNILSTNRSSLAAIISIALISWSGFSIHAQTISLISKTDLSIKIYFISKILHSLFAIFYGIIFFPIIENILRNEVLETFSSISNKFNSTYFLGFSLKLVLISLCILFVLTLIFKNKFKKCR